MGLNDHDIIYTHLSLTTCCIYDCTVYRITFFSLHCGRTFSCFRFLWFLCFLWSSLALSWSWHRHASQCVYIIWYL